MEPDVIRERESRRFQKSRWQQHPVPLVSVPLMDNWMPQLVSDSRSKPTILKSTRKPVPIHTKPLLGNQNSSNPQMEVETRQNKYSIQQPLLNGALKPRVFQIAQGRTETSTREQSNRRKPRNVQCFDRPSKGEEQVSVLLVKQGKLPVATVNVGKEANYDLNEALSSNLPNYMKPLNRSCLIRNAGTDQPKEKQRPEQPPFQKKTWPSLPPLRVNAKQANYKFQAVPSSHTQVNDDKPTRRSLSVNSMRKAPIVKNPTCFARKELPVPQNTQAQQPLDEACMQDTKIQETPALENAQNHELPRKSSNESNVTHVSYASSWTDETSLELLESSQSAASFNDDVPKEPPRQQNCGDAGVNEPQSKVTKAVKPRRKSRSSFIISKKTGTHTPPRSRPKTRKTLNRPYHGAVADPLRGEFPPNGNFQCKPAGMQNFISTIGMPCYELPASNFPQYSDVYLDMLEEAGIPLRKTIRESIKQANKKLQDPRPWMASKLAGSYLPRRQSLFPGVFPKRPQSPETMVGRLAKEDLISNINGKVATNRSSSISLAQEKITPGRSNKALGAKSKSFRLEEKTRGEHKAVSIRKVDKGPKTKETVVHDAIEGAYARQKTAADHILELMERKAALERQCTCEAAKRIEDLMVQNLRLREEVRWLEHSLVEERNSRRTERRQRGPSHRVINENVGRIRGAFPPNG